MGNRARYTMNNELNCKIYKTVLRPLLLYGGIEYSEIHVNQCTIMFTTNSKTTIHFVPHFILKQF
jgi:hypothetical protein